MLRGTACIAVAERTLTVGSGDCLYFGPGQDHQLLQGSPDLELFALAITPELAARLGSPCLAVRSTLEPGELSEVAQRLSACTVLTDAAAVESALVPLFGARASASVVHSATRRGLQRLLSEPSLSGAELAAAARVSPSELSRHFHRDLGVRFVEYRARLRLMEFVRRVDSGESMSGAALNADFGSYAQCHRVFRRILRCAPHEYFNGRRRSVDEAVCLPDVT